MMAALGKVPRCRSERRLLRPLLERVPLAEPARSVLVTQAPARLVRSLPQPIGAVRLPLVPLHLGRQRTVQP